MLVVLDAGHGGRDPGASFRHLKEKDLTLNLTRLTANVLEDKFVVNVFLTRKQDMFVNLMERAQLANERNADLFVSIHVNSGGGEGFESYVFTGLSRTKTGQYRNIVHEHVYDFYRRFGIANRGEKEANFAVLRETKMPSMLLENLFIDNAKDNTLLSDNSFLKNIANAIAMGIADALNLPDKPTTPADTSVNRPGTIYRVQAGAFRDESNAKQLASQLNADGFDAFVFQQDGLFHVQAGAFESKQNAEDLGNLLRQKGYEVFISS